MNKSVFQPADILIPKNIDMTKWSVVACDQYTSQPDYWNQVDKIVGQSPSALHISLPEIYLEDSNLSERIENINKKMNEYVANDLFTIHKDTIVYVERALPNGSVRAGLVGKIDLETYDYRPEKKALVRATEGTVIDRIPPRVKVRENAPLEMPHIMVLIDDPEKAIIEAIGEKRYSLPKIYDFSLMQNGGHITGYALTGDICKKVVAQLDNLCVQKAFDEKYDVTDKVMAYAVGDGNHSLATALTCYNKIKQEIGDKALNHPARYALVELVNLHSPSLMFEPIHRVVFGVDNEKFLSEMTKFFLEMQEVKNAISNKDNELVRITFDGFDKYFELEKAFGNKTGVVQKFIDFYIEKFGGKCDYIHGDDVAVKLGQAKGNIGILLHSVTKDGFFKNIILGGVLPRKTFSMGESNEKRFYLECRMIK